MARLRLLLIFAVALAVALFDGEQLHAATVVATLPVGSVPKQLQLSQDGSKLLVSNEASNSVSVISTATDTVLGTIAVGINPGPSRFTPDGAKAYVVNEDSDSVSVIDMTTLGSPATVSVGDRPVTASVSQDGTKVYVANELGNSVSVISTASDTVIQTIDVGVAPHALAKTPDGTKLYVANEGNASNSISVISTTSDAVIATIPLAPSRDPGSIHFLPNGTKAYVANRGCAGITCVPTEVDPTVSVINVATNTVIATIRAGLPGAAPHAMRITPDGSKLYLVNKHGDDVKVIDTATDTIIKLIALTQGSCFNITYGIGSCPVRVELTADGSKAYVVEQRPLAANGALTAICTGIVPSVCGGASTDTVVETVKLGSSPTDLEVLGDAKAYVSDSGSDAVSVVSLQSIPPPQGVVSGIYDLLVTLTPASGSPGAYLHCRSDIQQAIKNLTARIYCYVDAPGVAVNPEAGPESGDGFPGEPPPSPFGDVEDRHAVLTGFLDNGTSSIHLNGCFEDRDGYGPLGHVYWAALLDAKATTGTVDVWTFQTATNCLAGTPVGGPTFNDAPVTYGWLADKTSDHDSDADGCPDKKELTDNQDQGGLRDPFNPWDYFNPTHDGLNRVDDILKVVGQYFIDAGNPDYTTDTDRTAVVGANPWNLATPNGQQRVDDILASVKQYFHDC